MFSKDTREAIDLMMDNYNHSYSDSINFISKYYFDVDDPISSEIHEINEEKIIIKINTYQGSINHSIDFDQEPKDSNEVTSYFFLCLAGAREKAPDSEPLTKVEAQIERTKKLSTYFTKVEKVSSISANIIEIIFRGGLEALPNIKNDAFLYFIVPNSKDIDYPDGFSMATYRSLSAAEEEQSFSGAYYTIRSFTENQIKVWFVIHKDPGPLANWAVKASKGDKVAVWGPRTSFKPPQRTKKYLFIADETAQPAVLSTIESLKNNEDFKCVFETQNEDTKFKDQEKDSSIHWVFRNEDEAGSGSKLLEFIEGLDLETDGLYVFGAGEGKQMSKIRKLIKSKFHLTASQITLTGYWRKTFTN